MCECLSFRALVPKKSVQNNLSHQTTILQRVLCCFRVADAGCQSVLVKQRGFLLRVTPMANTEWHSEGLCTYSLKGEVKYLMFLFPSQWKVGKQTFVPGLVPFNYDMTGFILLKATSTIVIILKCFNKVLLKTIFFLHIHLQQDSCFYYCQKYLRTLIT